MRIVPSPKGLGRWQIWARRQADNGWTDWRLMGRYRTRWAARIVCSASQRNATSWGYSTQFEVRSAATEAQR